MEEGFRPRIEALLASAIDAAAEERRAASERDVEAAITLVREELAGTVDDAGRADLLLLWATGLEILEERDLALLKLEEAAEVVPDHEEALWRIASLLLEGGSELEVAIDILESRLLPLHDRAEYAEALAMARLASGLRSDGSEPRSLPDPGEDVDPPVPGR